MVNSQGFRLIRRFHWRLRLSPLEYCWHRLDIAAQDMFVHVPWQFLRIVAGKLAAADIENCIQFFQREVFLVTVSKIENVMMCSGTQTHGLRQVEIAVNPAE